MTFDRSTRSIRGESTVHSQQILRRAALLLVSRAQIVSRSWVMSRVDGRELPVELFAALVALERYGYLEHGGNQPDWAVRFVRLTPSGQQLLASLNEEFLHANLVLEA